MTIDMLVPVWWIALFWTLATCIRLTKSMVNSVPKDEAMDAASYALALSLYVALGVWLLLTRLL